MEKQINILVADDHPLFRDGLVKFLRTFEMIDRCDEAENGQIVLDKLKESHYDFVFLDIEMPVLNGIRTAEIIIKEYPEIKIIMLSVFCIKKEVIELIEMGVHSYILKNTNKLEMTRAFLLIAEGSPYFTPKVLDIWVNYQIEKTSDQITHHNRSKLSEREIQITRLLCEQKTAKEIGDKLFISEFTVNNHRRRIMQKMGVKHSIGLFEYAIKHKIYFID